MSFFYLLFSLSPDVSDVFVTSNKYFQWSYLRKQKIYVMSDIILTSFLIISRTKGTRNKTWFPTHKAQHICSHWNIRQLTKLIRSWGHHNLSIFLFMIAYWLLGRAGERNHVWESEICVQTSATVCSRLQRNSYFILFPANPSQRFLLKEWREGWWRFWWKTPRDDVQSSMKLWRDRENNKTYDSIQQNRVDFLVVVL